jgi:hypothetical protein
MFGWLLEVRMYLVARPLLGLVLGLRPVPRDDAAGAAVELPPQPLAAHSSLPTTHYPLASLMLCAGHH